ncbi:MAG: M13-type metalloendopeptidase, partial [Chloroflexota bacterium]
VFTNFYNPMTAEELQASAPFMDWTAYQEALGLTPQERLIVTDPNYLATIPGILEGTDLETLKAALTLQLMWGVASDLSDEIGQVAFDFKGKTLSGLEERAPLNERVLESVEQQLGFAVGKLYVEERFPPEAKAEVESLARDVIDAFRHRLENNPWMTPEARVKALDKLSKVDIQIGYPDNWESYADVVVGDSYFETGLSAHQHSIRKNLSELGKPVDKTEWGMPPQAVNAYYSPLNNQIVFPAAFLQEPFFYADAKDPAVNYGSIGYVIGHELTHGFDKQGSQFDGDGNLNSWYTPEDQAAFDALNQTLIDQYGAIEVAPGLFVNGVTSIGENTADLGGIQIAWDALQARLARDGIDPGEPDGVVEAPF